MFLKLLNPFTLKLQTTISHQHCPNDFYLKCKQRYLHSSKLNQHSISDIPFKSHFTPMDQPTSLHENPPPTLPPLDEHSAVDTSSPFRSVKEAVAMFGQRFLATEIYTPSPKPSFTLPIQESTPIWKYTPNSNKTLWKSPKNEIDSSPMVMNTLKKLELELEETKRQLNILKERETETGVSLASLNAELHKNMSKIAKAEAEVAGKAAAMRSSVTLAQVLSGSNADDDGAIEKGKEKKYLNEKKMLKKKPVIPLLTDLFSKKNGKSKNSKLSPLYTSSLMYWD